MASKAYVASMTVAELKAELNKRGMNTRGRKSELQDRLEMALYAEEDSESGSDSASGEPDGEQMVKQVLDSIVAPALEVEETSTDFSTFPISIHRSGLGALEEEEEEKPLKEERTEQLIVSIEHSRRIAASSQPSNLSQTSRSRRRRQRLNGGVTPSTAVNEREPVLQHQQVNLPCATEDSVENGEEVGRPTTNVEDMAFQEQTPVPVVAACENMVGGGVVTADEMTEVQQSPPQEPMCTNSPALAPNEQDSNASIPTASQSPPQSAQEEEISGVMEEILGKGGSSREGGQEDFVEEAASEQVRTDPPTEEYQHIPPTDPTQQEYQQVPPTEPTQQEYQQVPPTDPPKEEHQFVLPTDTPTEECQCDPPTEPSTEDYHHVLPTEPPTEECPHVPSTEPITEEYQHVSPTEPSTEEYQHVSPTEPTEEYQHVSPTEPITEEYQHVPPTEPSTEDYQHVPPTEPSTEVYQHVSPTEPPTEDYQHVPPTEPSKEEYQHVLPAESPIEEKHFSPTDPPTEEYQHESPTENYQEVPPPDPVTEENLPTEQPATPTEPSTEKYQDVPLNDPLAEERERVSPIDLPREEYVPHVESPVEEHKHVAPTESPMEESQLVAPNESPMEDDQHSPPTDPPREEFQDSASTDELVQGEKATCVQAEVVAEEMVTEQQKVDSPENLAENCAEATGICTPPAEGCMQETAPVITEVTKPASAIEIEQQVVVEQFSMPEESVKSANLEQQPVEKEEEETEEDLGVCEVPAEVPLAEDSQAATTVSEPIEQSSLAVERTPATDDGGSAVHMETVLGEIDAPTEAKTGESPAEPAVEVVETASKASEGDDGEKVGGDDVKVTEEEEGVEGQGQRVSADPAPIELDVVVHTVEEDDFSVFSAEASEAQNLDISTVATQPSSSTTSALSSSAAINMDGSVDNGSRNRKRASSLSDKDGRESSTESQPDSLKRRRISTSPKRAGNQERRRRWGSSSRSQHTPHAVISSDTLQGIIPESVRDSVAETIEGSSALEAVMSYGEAEKVEEDVLDIGKNDTLMDEYEHEWEQKEKERVREKEEQRKEIERARKELETRRRIEARMKAKKEEKQGRLSTSEDTRDTFIQRSPSPAQNPASPFLHLENLTRPFTLRQLKDLLEEDGPMVEKGFWTNKIKSHCIAVYAADETAVATRQRLHNLKWPSTNPKLLKADFLTAQEVLKISDGQLTMHSPTPSQPSAAMNSSPKEEELATAVVCETEEPRENEEKMEVDTKPEEPPVSEETVPLNKQDSFPSKESPKATKILDDLFRKTKAVPCIYWLPLNEEEATKKEAENKAREADRERRREERRKEREMELEKEKQRQQEKEREADRERRERERRLQEEQRRRARERMRRRRSWSRSRSRSRSRERRRR